MKLFRIWQKVNNEYDTYSSAIVAASDESAAIRIHPSSGYYFFGENGLTYYNYKDGPRIEAGPSSDWCKLEDVQVEEIGIAKNPDFTGVILASFHAG